MSVFAVDVYVHVCASVCSCLGMAREGFPTEGGDKDSLFKAPSVIRAPGVPGARQRRPERRVREAFNCFPCLN